MITPNDLLLPLTGEDGPSQMALEDLAMFRTIPGSVVFYPSDAVSAERAIELAANYQGVTFTRTSRPETTILYKSDELFEIGGAKVRGVWCVCVCVCVCVLYVCACVCVCCVCAYVSVHGWVCMWWCV